jgi:hypothetical protein
MNAVIDSPTRLLLADSSAIKVIIIYEDFLSGARAKHFAEQLAEGLGSTCPLSVSMWRSDILDCPSIAVEAARASADCDYLIVSLRGNRVLTPAARRWIEAKLNDAAGQLTCVIALLGSGAGTSRVLDGNRQYLRDVCAANRVEFCAHARMPSIQSAVTDSRGRKQRNEFDFEARRCLPAPLDA